MNNPGYASDFLIEDNSMLFLEGILKRVLITVDDKIEATIPLATDGKKFVKHADKFWIYRDNNYESSSIEDQKLKNLNLAILDANGNLLKSFVDIPKPIRDIHIASGRVFYTDTSDSSIYFFPTLSDTIYRFSNQMELISKYCIQENEDLQIAFPNKFDSKNRNELLQFLNNPATCIDKYIFIAHNQLIFLLSTSQNLFIAIHQPYNNTTTRYQINKREFSIPQWYWDGNFLFTVLPDPLNSELLSSLNQDDIEELTPNSNPVVLKLRIKLEAGG